jgi:hypothetical protein
MGLQGEVQTLGRSGAVQSAIIIVAKGSSQIAGVDHTETYAAVIIYDAVRFIFVIKTTYGMVEVQFDICTTYLNAHLIEIIFMEAAERVC